MTSNGLLMIYFENKIIIGLRNKIKHILIHYEYRIEILVQFLKRFNDLVMIAEDWFNETFDPLHDDFDLVNIQNYI